MADDVEQAIKELRRLGKTETSPSTFQDLLDVALERRLLISRVECTVTVGGERKMLKRAYPNEVIANSWSGYQFPCRASEEDIESSIRHHKKMFSEFEIPDDAVFEVWIS